MFAISKIATASPFLGQLKTKSSSFLPSSALFQFEQVAGFKYEPKRTNKKGLNIHRSNKAKAGLYHGKDKQFGHSISHSHHRSKRSWLPNVQKKRLWSDSLNQWIRFNATTTAIQAVDDIGGIDQYLLNLDEKYVQDSPFITKHRDLIARASYLNGELSPKHVHYFGFDNNPPLPGDITVSEENQKKVVRKNTFKDRRKAIIAKISKLRTGPPHNPLIEEAIRLKKEKRAQQAANQKAV